MTLMEPPPTPRQRLLLLLVLVLAPLAAPLAYLFGLDVAKLNALWAVLALAQLALVVSLTQGANNE